MEREERERESFEGGREKAEEERKLPHGYNWVEEKESEKKKEKEKKKNERKKKKEKKRTIMRFFHTCQMGIGQFKF